MSKVIVAGSINNDIVVLASRHPKTGESLIGKNVQYFPGGKGANQAIAAAKLGATTTLLGKVGNDSTGEQLTAFIASQGVTTNISLSNVATGTALITVSAQTADNTIIVVPGANMKLSEHDVTEVKIAKEDILVSQFEIPDDTIKYFFKKGKQIGAITLLNPSPSKNISNELLSLVDIIIINETELEMLSGLKILTDDDPSILNATKKITKVGQSIVVTLGAKGVLAVINEEIIKIDGKTVNAVDTTGAGDCFVGAVAASLANNSTLKEALEFGNIAASICTTRSGSGKSMPTLNEVLQN